MKKAIALILIVCLTGFAPSTSLRAAAQDYDNDQDAFFSPEQLDNLVAPVALYPDPLLAQVLLAATFPDQIDEADREMRAGYDHYDVDDAPWDVSVKAVAHYPRVLHMMADRLNWTTSLGQAYVYQSTDVMTAVQRLRMQARDAGYLQSTPQQEVVYRDGYVYVYPAQPRYIYVPVYDPGVVYVRHPGIVAAVAITFGAGLVIGAWLNHDCDWREHHVYYHGWDRDDDREWVARSRPYVHVTNVYVNNTYRTVIINRTVVNREVDYHELNRYNAVHRNVDYNEVRERHQRFEERERERSDGRRWDDHDNRGQRDNRWNNGNQRDEGNRGDWQNRGNSDNRWNKDNRGDDRSRDNDRYDVNNRIIRRNIDTNDPRIDANRGHWQNQQNQQSQSDNRQPDRHQSDNRPNWDAMRHDNNQQQNSVFRGNSGAFNPHEASQRGQESREQWNHPSTTSQRDNGSSHQQAHDSRSNDRGGGHQDRDNGHKDRDEDGKRR